jgi:hypothetical protein
VNTIRHVISVEPSRLHQLILLVGHLLLAALMWGTLHGQYWLWWLLILMASCCYALLQSRRWRGILELEGETLRWQEHSYQLGAGSRIGLGFLWLDLTGPYAVRLWIFIDSVNSADYRRLARHVNLLDES